MPSRYAQKAGNNAGKKFAAKLPLLRPPTDAEIDALEQAYKIDAALVASKVASVTTVGGIAGWMQEIEQLSENIKNDGYGFWADGFWVDSDSPGGFAIPRRKTTFNDPDPYAAEAAGFTNQRDYQQWLYEKELERLGEDPFLLFEEKPRSRSFDPFEN